MFVFIFGRYLAAGVNVCSVRASVQAEGVTELVAGWPPLCRHGPDTARAARAANLLRRAAISASERRHTAAGRRWLRSYLNGCAFKIFDAPLPGHLAGLPFTSACEWLYRTTGCVLIGARPTRRQRGSASLARRSPRLAAFVAVHAG